MRFEVTFHAVEQYIRRWEPDKDYRTARKELNGLIHNAHYTGKNRQGTMVFVSNERPEIRLLVKDNNVLITVLPPDSSLDLFTEMQQHQQELEEERKFYLQEVERRKAAIALEEQTKKDAINKAIREERSKKQIILDSINEERAGLKSEKEKIALKLIEIDCNSWKSIYLKEEIPALKIKASEIQTKYKELGARKEIIVKEIMLINKKFNGK